MGNSEVGVRRGEDIGFEGLERDVGRITEGVVASSMSTSTVKER